MAEENILILKQLDDWIKGGKANKAKTFLSAFNISKVPRPQIVEFADLARRVQSPYLILRWLRPIVRPETPVHPEATAKEIAVYALALARVGVFDESQILLKSQLKNKENTVFFYLGLSYLEQWNYLEAQFPFQQYLKSDTLTDYQKTVGMLNLAACYVAENNIGKAWPLLLELNERCKSLNSPLLEANSLELMSQHHIMNRNYDSAQACLLSAQNKLTAEHHQYEFFIRKWLAINHLLSHPQEDADWLTIRHEAQQSKLYESVRDCDFYWALAKRNDKKFLDIYFGSHFSHYKKRILRVYDWNDPIPLSWVRENSPFEKNKELLKPEEFFLPSHLQNLIQILLSDNYRPFPLPQLFSQIYKYEYFNPLTSIKKIEQLLFRLRQELKNKNVPLHLSVEKGKVWLHSDQALQIHLSRRNKKIDSRLMQKLELLNKKFNNSHFDSQEASQVLSLPTKSCSRWLKKAADNGYLNKRQAAKGFQYMFKKRVA